MRLEWAYAGDGDKKKSWLERKEMSSYEAMECRRMEKKKMRYNLRKCTGWRKGGVHRRAPSLPMP